jgi:SlyX protein
MKPASKSAATPAGAIPPAATPEAAGAPPRKSAARVSARSVADARLHEVEVKLSFVDDLVDSLNRTVYRQQQQIDQLAQALSAVRRQLPSGAAAGAGDLREDLPPHY